MRGERQEVGKVADGRELAASEQLDGSGALEMGEVEFDALDVPGQVDDNQKLLVVVSSGEGQDFAVLRSQELEAAVRKCGVGVADGDQAPHPPQERVRIA